MKLIKLLANLGYGSRKEMEICFKRGLITHASGDRLSPKDDVAHQDIRFKGRPLDPPQGMVLMMYKPTGYVCSTKDHGHLVYELLPDRFSARKPLLSTIGRLDADTSGLLLFTDDGDFLHKIISPRNHVPKIYEVSLDRPLEGHEKDLFASGTLILNEEKTPLKPAFLEVVGEKQARLTLYEGRYHQVRRMFAAAGNHVTALERSQMGGLRLVHENQSPMKLGEWRLLKLEELALILAPTA